MMFEQTQGEVKTRTKAKPHACKFFEFSDETGKIVWKERCVICHRRLESATKYQANTRMISFQINRRLEVMQKEGHVGYVVGVRIMQPFIGSPDSDSIKIKAQREAVAANDAVLEQIGFKIS